MTTDVYSYKTSEAANDLSQKEYSRNYFRYLWQSNYVTSEIQKINLVDLKLTRSFPVTKTNIEGEVVAIRDCSTSKYPECMMVGVKKGGVYGGYKSLILEDQFKCYTGNDSSGKAIQKIDKFHFNLKGQDKLVIFKDGMKEILTPPIESNEGWIDVSSK